MLLIDFLLFLCYLIYITMANFIQLDIPHTTPKKYITGYYALNIPDRGEVADWHSNIFWRPVGVSDPQTKITLGGDGSKHNTNPIFDRYGVRNATSQIKNMGLSLPEEEKKTYVANHSRAILDMLFYQLKELGEATELTNATIDWLPTPKKAEKTLARATILTEFLNDTQKKGLARWIDHERKVLYNHD